MLKIVIIKMTKSTAVYYDFNRDKQIKAVMNNTHSHDEYLELEHELFSMYYRDYHLWMHKDRYFKKLCSDLFQYHQKRQNYTALRDELIPLTWHPDRVWDWCFDEEHKKESEELWS